MRLLRFFGLWNRSSTVRWLLRLFRKAVHRKALDAELRFHLEQQIADDIAGGTASRRGTPPRELEFGGLEQPKKTAAMYTGKSISRISSATFATLSVAFARIAASRS